MIEAKYFRRYKDDTVICELCPHYCKIEPEKTGLCRARKNIYGILYSLNYGQAVSVNVDPIEKKPLYHFFPGDKILSLGPNSCNLKCSFCQNYTISQTEVGTTEITPETLLKLTKIHFCNFVAFTYTEPTTWFEYVLDASKFLQENGVKTVMITNGYINPKPLKELLPYISAWNIDLKAIHDYFYVKNCSGTLEPVLKTIKTIAKKSHLEITNLIIPGENDSGSEIIDLVDFIADINPNIPLHISRYFPSYKMKKPPTPLKTLYFARDIAQKKLNYVYLGNIDNENKTFCPSCGKLLVERGHETVINVINGKCPICNTEIYGNFA
ncbi:MAG: hypothetical protein APR54_05870 [Candidatus Cloacimonas sp. SDB]|nr:MAG: hypothetical protein APR54_05870 [Candidatus Cloacimonas sp. SDB]